MMEALAVSPPEQSPLIKALQDQLRGIVEKPITVLSLLELQQTAVLARKLLELQDPKAKLTRRLNGGLVGFNAYNDFGGAGFEAENVDQAVQPSFDPGVLAPAPGSETFGAAVIRELIPAIKRQAQGGQRSLGLSELLEARSLAGQNTALVQRIDAKIERLFDEDEESDAPASPPLGTGCKDPGCIETACGPSGLCFTHYDKASVQVRDELQAADAGG